MTPLRELTSDEKERLIYLSKRGYQVGTRASILLAVSEGSKSNTEIAKELGICRENIYKIVQRFNDQGLIGVEHKGKKYNVAQCDAIIEVTKTSPHQFGYPRWTMKRLQEQIKKQLDISISLRDLGNIFWHNRVRGIFPYQKVKS